MRFLTLIFLPFIFLTACGGGGGGSLIVSSNDITNVPTCSDTGTAFQTTEYYWMDYNDGTDQALARVCASTAYAAGVSGQGVDIAIMDTGLALYSNGNVKHDEFGSTGDSTPSSKVVLGTGSDAAKQYWSHVNDNVPEDNDGHGTHVAGIAAADKDGQGMHGIAYNATIYPVKMMDPFGTYWNASAWAFYRTITYDIDIVNMSWGPAAETQIGSTGTYSCNSESSCESWIDNYRGETYFYDYLEYMSTYDDIIQVWAAGNDGLANPQIYGGSCIYDNERKELCVLVAALGTDGKLASFSNKCGEAHEYCITAPGTNIVSAMHNDSDGYIAFQGTSMAAPMVSGGLALIREKFSSLTSEQVIDRLFVTATDHDVYSQSSIYGHGLMDIGAAITNVGTLQILSTPSSNLDRSDSVYSEVLDNKFEANTAFQSALLNSVKDKTIEVYDSFDRANFSINLDNFFKNTNLRNINSTDNRLNNLLLADDYQTSKKNKFGKILFNNRNNLNHNLFTSHDKRLNIGVNVSANNFFNQSKRTLGINTTFINNKLYDNPYFYRGKQSISLSFNDEYLSSEVFLNNEAENYGYSINFQPTSINFLDNNKYGDVELSFGNMFEENKILNSFGTGVFSINKLSKTKFTRMKYNYFNNNLNIFANINFGSSEINSNNSSYIRNSDSVITRSYAFGLIKDNFLKSNNKFALVISQPQKVIDGQIKITIPTASNNERDVTYSNYDLNLVSSKTEINYDLFYLMKLSPANSLYFNISLIDNPNHNSHLNSYYNASLVYKKLF